MITKIAAIQMCSSPIIDDNLACAEYFITMAVEQGAQLIVLPEMFAIMANKSTSKACAKEFFGCGKIQDFLANQARNHQIWLIGGTIPIVNQNDEKPYSTLLVFDDKGQCVAHYNKIHLFDVVLSKTERYCESDTVKAGSHIVTIDSPFGRLGFAVCYDIRFPELFRCLFNQGMDILILPAAFTEKTGQAHWEILARSRAIENLCYFIGACQGGHHANGRKTHGQSLIIDPWGMIVACKTELEPGVITATIDLTTVRKARNTIPINAHQRIFCDSSNL